MTTGKTIALTRRTFVGKVISLLFNMLSRFVIAFFPRSKRLLISSLQSPSTVTLKPKKKICHCFHFFPFYLPWSDGTWCHDIHFLNLSFKPAFSLSSFTLKRLFSYWESCKSLFVYVPSYLFVYPSCPSIYHISIYLHIYEDFSSFIYNESL